MCPGYLTSIRLTQDITKFCEAVCLTWFLSKPELDSDHKVLLVLVILGLLVILVVGEEFDRPRVFLYPYLLFDTWFLPQIIIVYKIAVVLFKHVKDTIDLGPTKVLNKPGGPRVGQIVIADTVYGRFDFKYIYCTGTQFSLRIWSLAMHSLALTALGLA
jgi:hypothetical protein